MDFDSHLHVGLTAESIQQHQRNSAFHRDLAVNDDGVPRAGHTSRRQFMDWKLIPPGRVGVLIVDFSPTDERLV